MVMRAPIACHRFETDSLDARCTETHPGRNECCTMTRGYLFEALNHPESVGTQCEWTGHGTFNQSEFNQIKDEYERIVGRAHAAIGGVCGR